VESLWGNRKSLEDIYNGADFVVAIKYHAFGKTFLSSRFPLTLQN
jgi:hypothetical protein